ncbi:hypothetical protein D3C87_82220 [compost metagenome]
MFDDYKSTVIARINEILDKTPFIENYHVTKTPVDSLLSSYKEKMLIRLWVKQDLKDIYDVADSLTDGKTFEKNIRELAKSINCSVTFDIYEK